jgi:hypothetical protein
MGTKFGKSCNSSYKINATKSEKFSMKALTTFPRTRVLTQAKPAALTSSNCSVLQDNTVIYETNILGRLLGPRSLTAK